MRRLICPLVIEERINVQIAAMMTICRVRRAGMERIGGGMKDQVGSENVYRLLLRILMNLTLIPAKMTRGER